MISKVDLLPGYTAPYGLLSLPPQLQDGRQHDGGRRGAWFTLGPRGTRTTVGVLGTGLSYTEQSSGRRGAGIGAVVLLVVLVLVAMAMFGG